MSRIQVHQIIRLTLIHLQDDAGQTDPERCTCLGCQAHYAKKYSKETGLFKVFNKKLYSIGWIS